MNTIIEEDVDFVKSYYEIPDEEIDMDKISPWLLRKANKFDENEGFKPEVEWMMLDTEGVNLLTVMGHEDVDALRTTGNHVIEGLEVLGIEAARRRCLMSFERSLLLNIPRHPDTHSYWHLTPQPCHIIIRCRCRTLRCPSYTVRRPRRTVRRPRRTARRPRRSPCSTARRRRRPARHRRRAAWRRRVVQPEFTWSYFRWV
nr:DNA-directed RNA polymerase II subunit 1 [Tanacetum cinerariifolium]